MQNSSILNIVSLLPEQLKIKLLESLETETAAEKHILIKEGERARKLYFVSEGMLRSYYTDERGETTTAFYGSGHLALTGESFFNQAFSKETLCSQLPSKLKSIRYQILEDLCNSHPEMNRAMRSILQHYYFEKEKEVRMFREQSVKQRLESLLEQFPGIFSCCSQKQVASYLGTSHEALCRVRAKR